MSHQEVHTLLEWQVKQSEQLDQVIPTPEIILPTNIIDIGKLLDMELKFMESTLPKNDIAAAFMFEMHTFDANAKRRVMNEILERKKIFVHWSAHLAKDLQERGVDEKRAESIQQHAWQQELDKVAIVTPLHHDMLKKLADAETTRRQISELLSDTRFTERPVVQAELHRALSISLEDRQYGADGAEGMGHELILPFEFMEDSDAGAVPTVKKQR